MWKANVTATGNHSHAAAPASLELGEANQLSAAAVARLARLHGVRALLIKGLGLQHHGLRPARASADIDVLVEPGSLEVLYAALTESGWKARAETAGGHLTARHSRTLSNPNWPNDLDIHHEYPGFLSGSEHAFEVLWANCEEMFVGGQVCLVPDRWSSVAIWALHSLRSNRSDPRHADELERLANVVLPSFSTSERNALAGRVTALGADVPLRVVPEFAEIIGDRHGPQAPGALEAWNAKVAQAHEATPWLQVLRDARPMERPWLLFRAVWPSAHDLRLMDEVLVDTPLGRVRSRRRRAWRLARRIAERRRQGR